MPHLISPAWRRLQGLFFRRDPEPPTAPSLVHSMVMTSGADEMARRQRLRRIHGEAPSWIDRPERDRLRRDLHSYPHEDR